MLLVLAGLPEPLVKAPVHDEHGHLLGIPDLLYLRPLFGIEYDGRYHREPGVHQADIVRENGLLTAGLPLLRYSSYDLRQQPSLVLQQVRAALRMPA
jgi:very-short-patch-repair endonuclease